MKIIEAIKKFGSQKEPEVPVQTEEKPELDVYAGMRVEVISEDNQLLFVAKLLALREDSAELHLYSESAVPDGSEPMHALIRGYSDYERKAVYMEGTVSPVQHHIWKVERLQVSRIGNDRAFFRLNTELKASITRVGRIGAGMKTCTMLNISIGGACISTDETYHKNDKFLLNVQLLEDREPSVMLCEVLRITAQDNGKFEYGCRFLALSESDKERITQNIFAVQRKKRGVSR